MKSLVSVVITCYNYGRFLSQAIESVLAQTYPQVEAIVVDDGSTDDTSKVAQAYLPRISYIRQENVGVAKSRNRGVKGTKGEFINFLDADDWIEPNKIEIQMRRFEIHPQLDVVTCGWKVVDESGIVRETTVPRWGPNALDHLLNNNSFLPACALIRKSALERVRGFCEDQLSESWTEDTDLWLRLGLSGSLFHVEPEALCCWRRHQSIVSRSQNIDASLSGFGKMIDRLEAMNTPSVGRERWRSFRALSRLAFCGRFYGRGEYDRAREIFLQVMTEFPDLARTPRTLWELYHRSRPMGASFVTPSTAGELEDMKNTLLYELLPTLNKGLDRSHQRMLHAVGLMNFVDLAYSIGDLKLARTYALEALSRFPRILGVGACLPSLARAAAGPRVGGAIGKVARRLRSRRV